MKSMLNSIRSIRGWIGARPKPDPTLTAILHEVSKLEAQIILMGEVLEKLGTKNS